jgi:hypothetical protein
MGSFTDSTLAGLRNTFLHKREEREAVQREHGEILNTLENVVDGTDGRIRLVSGYRKQLQDGVRTALAYVDELVARIPAAIDISSRNFTSDPYVNAFFTNINDLHTVFRHSSEIRDFMDTYGNRDDMQCCCLLCMQKTEKPVLGMALSGDILHKNVLQTSVSFSDHRIYSPEPTEAAARQGLRECLLGGLITSALGRIMQAKAENYRLQSDRRMLHARLRHLEYRNRRTPSSDRTNPAAEIRETSDKLQNVEKLLMNARPATPQTSLNQVRNLLEQPENFIRLRKSTLRLDKMGIVLDGDASCACNRLELTEALIGEEQPRVITLAQFPVQEFSPQSGSQAPNLFS